MKKTYWRVLGMSTEANINSKMSYQGLTEALIKVYDMIKEETLDGPELIRNVDDYLHSVTMEFRKKHSIVLGNHVPELIDVSTVLKKIMMDKEKEKQEDKWDKVVVRGGIWMKLKV